MPSFGKMLNTEQLRNPQVGSKRCDTRETEVLMNFFFDMQLCYVFISNYKCLKNVGITISNKYLVSFDNEKNVLTITKNENYLENFWGEGISSFATIVGNNGAGKSSAIDVILSQLVSGYNNPDSIDCFFVYEDSSRKIKVWNRYQRKINVIIDGSADESCFVNERPRFDFLYYSGHFSMNINASPRSSQLYGMQNISQNSLLANDYETYVNKGASLNNDTFRMYCDAHIRQNGYRICSMLADRPFCEKIQQFILPKFIAITYNQYGKKYFNGETLPKPNVSFSRKGDAVFSDLIYYGMLNIFAENQHSPKKRLKSWTYCINQNFKDNSPDIIDVFETFLATHKINGKVFVNDSLAELCTFCKGLKAIITIQQNDGTAYIETRCEKKMDELLKLLKMQRNHIVRFVDLDYHHSVGQSGDQVLSSGEYAILNLFSRIYDVYLGLERKKCPSVLFLDEADLGYHPEWQRQFVKLLTDFMNKIYEVKGNNGIDKFQIVTTTHTPISLSDIPKDSITFLKKGNSVTSNVTPNISNTFGANVFDLFRSSFFMEGGLIGEFAAEKIKDINGKLNDKKNVNIKEIELIGDVRIKMYLLEKLSQTEFAKDALKSMKNIIKEIEERLKENE